MILTLRLIFKWIHPEEVLLFFWTESNLLQKLSQDIHQTKDNTRQEELYADIHLLANLFVFMQEQYDKKEDKNGIRFIPTPLSELVQACSFFCYSFSSSTVQLPNENQRFNQKWRGRLLHESKNYFSINVQVIISAIFSLLLHLFSPLMF